MVWSRASLVVGVQQHGGLARRLWHSPVAASAAAVAKAAPLHCCGLPRHRLTTPRRLRRNCRAALLHGCTAAPICCAAPAAAVTAYCRTAPPSPLSYGSATAAHCRAASYIAATPRHAAPAAAPRRSAAAASLSCCCPTPPPHRFATAAPLLYTAALLRSAPLRVTLLHAASSAPRRLAAAALLRCCRAASLLPLHSASSSRMRLNQSLLGLEHSKTCSASCTVGACLLHHRCFLCIAPFCTAPSVSTVQSAWTLTSWGSSRSQERIAIMIRMMVCVVTVTVVVSIVIHTLLVPNDDPLRKATQARFPSPLSNCLVCRCNSY